jgi:hypothetical protein
VERASVTTVAYEASENPERPTLRIRSYEGQVRPHPSFQILLDASGAQRTNDADLSVIWLDRPVELPHRGVRLADSEVRPQESLMMAGYGHDRVVGSRHGARYFRENQVTRVPAPAKGWALYAQQGASLYEGFDGGPCFREEGQEQRLVGIAGMSTSEALSFTSTFFYQDWLRSELQRAEAAGTAESPAFP